MAIKVNHKDDRVDKPVIKIIGQKVDLDTDSSDYGVYSSADTHTLTPKEQLESENKVRNADILTFKGDVTIEIVTDSDYSYSSYNTDKDIVGDAEASNTVNKNANTYYSLNGKDPKINKSYLYYKSFTVKSNLSGDDNTLIKAKTYARGKESEIATVEFRIINDDKTYGSTNNAVEDVVDNPSAS